MFFFEEMEYVRGVELKLEADDDGGFNGGFMGVMLIAGGWTFSYAENGKLEVVI